jgi:nitroreductase/FMN reductase [NAD(P)H]
LPYGDQCHAGEYGQAEFYGWPEDKARQVSKPERADFGQFVHDKRY